MSTDVPLDERMTASELAEAIEIDQATIAKWRRHGHGFPAGLRYGRVWTYTVGELLTWLDARPIPGRNLRVEGDAEATYGARLRSYLAFRSVPVTLRSGPDDPASAVRDARALVGRGFPASASVAVLDAVLVLTFVWVVDENAWERIASYGGKRGFITAEVDAVLRRHGIAGVAEAVIGALKPARPDVMRGLVKICARLGVRGYEAIHRGLAAAEGREASTYPTPQAVAELMAGCVIPTSGAPVTVADLYCRHGELVGAVAEADSGQGVDVEVSGHDPRRMHRVRMSLIMHGHRVSGNITATEPWWRAPKRRNDAVVVNPPFNQVLGAVDVTWDYGAPPEHSANFAWLQAALKATAEHGRAAVLMPVSAATSSDEHEQSIRKELVDAGAVRAVIRLSRDLFPVSSVDTTVWVLEHPRRRGPQARIVMVDATSLKFKTRERERPVLAGVERISELVRDPFGLVLGESRSVIVEHAIGPARVVAVPVSAVAAQNYRLTPHTYLANEEIAGEVRLQRITESAHSAQTALAEVRATRSIPQLFVREDILPSGYPANWKVRKIGELCEIKAGTRRLTKSQISTGDDADVPVLRPSSLKTRRVRDDALDRTTEKVAQEFAEYRLRAGDLLTVRAGQVQDVAIVSAGMDEWLFDSNLNRIRVREGAEVDSGYLLEFLLCRRTGDRIKATASEHVAPTVSARELADLEVPVPPLEQQRAIAAALAEREQRIVSLRAALRADEEGRDVLAEALVTGVVGLVGM
ncbi:N-6 DNA methylase [Nocardia sp. CA-120079]|uniref:N-6 DNA methylase n=1 Tax=Nocardia sp. CA-120079 TaxID=3239974 RepID=UPI003D968F3A